jgi:predicted transcriptional regulator
MRTSKTRELSARISTILGIRGTGRKILDLLIRAEKGLRISDIIVRTERSERSIRAHLKTLLGLKLIKKETTKTKKGRVAHRYSVQVSGLVKSVRKEMLKRLRELERSVEKG